METPIIVALISSSVAVVSVITSIVIANKTRENTKRVLLIQSKLEAQKELNNELKIFLANNEQFRITIWRLKDSLDRLYATFESKHNASIMKDVLESLSLANGDYLDSWAPVKIQIPDIVIGKIRSDRHAIREITRSLSRILHQLQSIIESKERFDLVIPKNKLMN